MNKPLGFGVIEYNNGECMEGEFIEGKFTGKGILFKRSEYKYTVEIKLNKPHGFGVLKF